MQKLELSISPRGPAARAATIHKPHPGPPFHGDGGPLLIELEFRPSRLMQLLLIQLLIQLMQLMPPS